MKDIHKIDSKWLKNLALECGADDVGLASISSPLLSGEKSI